MCIGLKEEEKEENKQNSILDNFLGETRALHPSRHKPQFLLSCRIYSLPFLAFVFPFEKKNRDFRTN